MKNQHIDELVLILTRPAIPHHHGLPVFVQKRHRRLNQRAGQWAAPGVGMESAETVHSLVRFMSVVALSQLKRVDTPWPDGESAVFSLLVEHHDGAGSIIASVNSAQLLEGHWTHRRKMSACVPRFGIRVGEGPG